MHTCPCHSSPEAGLSGHCPLVDQRRARGTVLYRAGDPVGAVWFVRRGAVVLTRAVNRVETPYQLRRAGAFLGLEALVRNTYLDTATVIIPAVLGSASRELVSQWFNHGPAARMALEQLLRMECDGIPRCGPTEGSALERVARWVASESALPGHLQIPRRYAAGLLGMTPETFSRALARLAQSGAISVSRRAIAVLDEEALAASQPAG